MKSLTESMIKMYYKKELQKLKKRIKNYIVPIEYEKIEWISLNNRELYDFYNENYYDENNSEYIYWIDCCEKMPIGLTYLVFPPNSDNLNYFIGFIPNKDNKKTIIGCICYRKDYILRKGCDPVTIIETVEINYFYQGNGLLSLMLDSFTKWINKNQNIIVTDESISGQLCRVFEHIKDSLLKNGYFKNISLESNVDEEYIKKLSINNNRTNL